MTSQGIGGPRVGELSAGGWGQRQWDLVGRWPSTAKPVFLVTRVPAVIPHGLGAFPALAANRLVLNRCTRLIRPRVPMRLLLARWSLPSARPIRQPTTMGSSLVALRSALGFLVSGIRPGRRREYPTLTWFRRKLGRNVSDGLEPDDSEGWLEPGVEMLAMIAAQPPFARGVQPLETLALEGQSERWEMPAHPPGFVSSREAGTRIDSSASPSHPALRAVKFASAVESRAGGLSREPLGLARDVVRPDVMKPAVTAPGVAKWIVSRTAPSPSLSLVQPLIPLPERASAPPSPLTEPALGGAAGSVSSMGRVMPAVSGRAGGEDEPSLAGSTTEPAAPSSPEQSAGYRGRSEDKIAAPRRSLSLTRALATAARQAVQIVARSLVPERGPRPTVSVGQRGELARGDGELPKVSGLDSAGKGRGLGQPAQDDAPRVPQTPPTSLEPTEASAQPTVPLAKGAAAERPRQRVVADRGERRFPRLVDFGRRFVAALRPKPVEEPAGGQWEGSMPPQVAEARMPTPKRELPVSADRPVPGVMEARAELGPGAGNKVRPQSPVTLAEPSSSTGVGALTHPRQPTSWPSLAARVSRIVSAGIGTGPTARSIAGATIPAKRRRLAQVTEAAVTTAYHRPEPATPLVWLGQEGSIVAPERQGELVLGRRGGAWPLPVPLGAAHGRAGADVEFVHLPAALAAPTWAASYRDLSGGARFPGGGPGKISISLAPADRAVGETRPGASAAEPMAAMEDGAGKPEPSPEEVERLAGSVYRLIKHRLAVERERTTGFRSEFFG